MASYLFSSESVTEGHPDKLCDQVSDAIVDACLAVDPNSRVACESVAKTGFVLLAGEITTRAQPDYQTIVRNVVRDIGFVGSDTGFDADTCAVMVSVAAQSPDIAQGVDRGDLAKQGAGDQGLMFGYACDETKELMPMPIQLAHQLAFRLAEVRKKKIKGVDFLRPDGKTQVSVRYEDGQIKGVEAVVVSTQHSESAKNKQIEEAIRELVIKPIVPAHLITNKTKFHINPTGRFVIGGPHGDAGVTGRKIIVDTAGTGIVSDDILTKAVLATFDARPGMLIQELNLRRPIFRQTSAYGHFGRELPEFTWEKTPHVAKLRDAAGVKGSTAATNGKVSATAAKASAKPAAKAPAKKAALKAPPPAKKKGSHVARA